MKDHNHIPKTNVSQEEVEAVEVVVVVFIIETRKMIMKIKHGVLIFKTITILMNMIMMTTHMHFPFKINTEMTC